MLCFPTNNSLDPSQSLLLVCFSSLEMNLFAITFIFLLLPFCLLILYLGFQRWRSSAATAAPSMSHCDMYTFHLVFIELVAILGWVVYLFSIYTSRCTMTYRSVYSVSFNIMGEMCFQNLTCLEHYLAVVHPITYLNLKTQRGIRIRKIAIVCIWVFSFVSMYLVILCPYIYTVCLSILSLICVTFFSLSVLHVLIRPGPGEQGGDREMVHWTKQRAFYTIVAVLALLLLKFVGHFLFSSVGLGETELCAAFMVELWLSLPSSLLLPVLFLLRVGKIACCKKRAI